MRQVGTVDAAEINRVSEWLAGLVREEALPQKLLIVHQFHFSMITNRHRIETPPELAVLIHMDGHGTQGHKQDTWDALTAAPDADGFYWGWKNFYDEDSASSIGRCTVPVMMTGANTSTNRWRYQHARRTAGVARTRGDLLRSS